MLHCRGQKRKGKEKVCAPAVQSLQVNRKDWRIRMEILQKNYQIIAVDFDGTLCFSNWPDLGEPNLPLITFLKRWREAGNKLILWTCRADKALSDAVRWCGEQGLSFDAVNDNRPEVVAHYGTNSRKITCDYYIDDRMLLPLFKLPSSEQASGKFL